MSVFGGVMFHAIGASSASLCYTPEKKVQGWSWQSYWLAQALICWVILPIVGAMITIPELMTVLEKAPTDAMWKSFGLGAVYGIGGTMFGLAIRHIGFSLTYAIAIGISCVLGTLLPPWVNGELVAVLSKPGSGYIINGILLGIVGIGMSGVAGRFKEQDLSKNDQEDSSFNLTQGLILAILAGILSALYGFSLNQGQPIADVAAEYGAGQYQGNVIYIFSNTGAFLFSLFYCVYLHVKEGTFQQYLGVSGGRSVLTKNYLLSVLTGCMWYAQFFFYGLGHTRMGDYEFTSWAIHMIMLMMFSMLAGVMLKEWKGSSGKTVLVLTLALAVLFAAVIALTIGNQIGVE